jgi:hypothetical protein
MAVRNSHAGAPWRRLSSSDRTKQDSAAIFATTGKRLRNLPVDAAVLKQWA